MIHMAWKAYYEHDCPEDGSHDETSQPEHEDPPVCDTCGEEYTLVAD